MYELQASTILSLFSILFWIYYTVLDNIIIRMSAIDKIVIYGVANPQRLKVSQVLANKITVSTLELYQNPLTQQPHESHHRTQQIDFQMWAYPDGIKIYNNRLQIINDSEPEFTFFQPEDLLASNAQDKSKLPPEYIYSFVLTDYDLNRTYCTCIIWNERYFIKDDREAVKGDKELTKSMTENMSKNQQRMLLEPKEQYSLAVPKCRLETMINNPLILDTTTTLVYVPKAMILCSKTPCIQFQRSLLTYYYKNIISETTGKEKKTIRIPRLIENSFGELVKNFGYPRAEATFNESRSETVRKMQMQLLKNSMKDIEKDRSWGLLSVETGKLKDFFLSSLFTVPEAKKNSFVMTELGQKIGSRLKSDTVFHLPKYIDLFSLQQQGPRQPLLPLPIPQFIQLWKCLLLQKQIIIFSNSQKKSVLLCQLMLHLLQPIKWQNIYIPFLPFHLAHHIDAIGGYLIGMSRIHMDYMLEKFQMKSKVVVDLQHQTILEEGGKEVIQLPESVQLFLEKELKGIVQAYEDFMKPNRSLINYLILNPLQQTEKEAPKHMQNYVKSHLKIQKTFFHSLVVLFNNFIPFIQKKEDGIISVRTNEYLDILEDKLHRNFMKQISKTMVFIRLCQYHMEQSQRCAWVQRSIGELFVYSHDILSHKFIVFDSDISKNENNLGGGLGKKETKKANAWTIQDLMLPHEKYNQYIEYLFEKNSKQILNTVTTIDIYLGIEQAKYKILSSEDQFQSFQELQSIQIPADFGKKGLKTSSQVVRKADKELQYQNIYEQIQSKQVTKSKRYKKYGDKDEDQLYDEVAKLCTDIKIEKYLIKYLKYMELNFPDSLVKQSTKHPKKQSNKNGILNWLWDLVNPPDSTRGKQQTEVKSKLQKKMTMKNIKMDSVLNLQCLFGIGSSKMRDEGSHDKKRKESSLDQEIEKGKDKHEKVEIFLEKIKEKGKRVSHTHSDVVHSQPKIEKQI